MANTVTRADLRLGQSWTRGQRMKNDAIWVLASVAMAAARLMPAGLRTELGGLLGEIAHATAARPRRLALANVARALPDLDPSARRALVRRCFRTLGKLLGETVGLDGAHTIERLLVTSEAGETLERARREGRGVLFPSAHLGPWERVAASIAATGIPFTVLTRDSYDPRFSRAQNRIRRSAGINVIRRTSGVATSAGLGVVRALRRGEVVGVAMDLRARVASCDAPFLGAPASTAVGPARIALRTGAPVVVGSAAPENSRTKDGLVVTATRIATEDLRDCPDGALELTARINAELSRRILAIPHAWVWMHARWGGEGEL
jgi:KDO2-lipid IV(A) lauroyltransferase